MVTADVVARLLAKSGLEPASLVLERLDAPAEAVRIDPDNRFYPASMIKTPLAAAVYAHVSDGGLKRDDAFEVAQTNMTANDKPSPLVPVAHLTEPSAP